MPDRYMSAGMVTDVLPCADSQSRGGTKDTCGWVRTAETVSGGERAGILACLAGSRDQRIRRGTPQQQQPHCGRFVKLLVKIVPGSG